MKTLKALSLSLMAGAAIVAFTGCSTAQKGAASGGIVGGAVGSVVANHSIHAPMTGAAVGGASGAAVGGLAGDAFDQVELADKERELENLQDELEEKERELASLRESGLTTDALARLESKEAEVEQLRASLDAARAEAEQLAANRADMSTQLLERQARLSELESQLDARDADVDLLRSQIQEARQREAELAEAKSQLNMEISETEAELTSLKSDLQDREQKLSEREKEIQELRDQIAMKEEALDGLSGEVEVLRTSLNGKEQQINTMSSELEDLNVELQETARGLTLTIVDSLLYQPGEAVLTDGGEQLVSDVAAIINDNFPGRELLIEGHTDNQPIVHSGWRSNWELGAARALTLLHELVDSHGVDPDKVSATSFGEFRPVATNATETGRAENRRAVIVILPEKLPLQRESLAKAE